MGRTVALAVAMATLLGSAASRDLGAAELAADAAPRPQPISCRVPSGDSWSADGHWYAVVRSARTGANAGSPVLVVIDVRTNRARVLLASRKVIGFAWAPRRNRLVAGTEDGSIYVGTASSRLKPLVRGCFGAWSPDASRIAYVADGWASAIDVARLRTTRLAPASEVDDWSSDGERLAITRPQRLDCGSGTEQHARVHVLRMRDRLVQQISPDGRMIDGTPVIRGRQSDATFSPDGSRLVFNEGLPCGRIAARWDPYLFIAPGDREVARGRAAWAPSSRYLTVRSSSSSPPASVITPSGRRIASLPHYGSDWSPDGGRLVFARADSPDSGTWDDVNLYVVPISNLDRMRKLATGFEPEWSPDGRRIAFRRYLGSGGCGIFVVSLRGGQPRRLIRC